MYCTKHDALPFGSWVGEHSHDVHVDTSKTVQSVWCTKPFFDVDVSKCTHIDSVQHLPLKNEHLMSTATSVPFPPNIYLKRVQFCIVHNNNHHFFGV